MNASNCNGACIPHGNTYSECSGVCSYGTASCGQTNMHPPLDFFCYLDPSTFSGDGDLGNCAKVCDCDNDCGRPDAVCEPKPALKDKTGRVGVCGSAIYPTGAKRPGTPCKI
jgi:hypothetical protein